MGKNSEKKISLKVFLFLFLGTGLLFFLCAILFNGFSAIHLMQSRIISESDFATTSYSEQLCSELNRIDTYLYTASISDYDFNRLAYMEEGAEEWYNTLANIRSKLDSASYLYSADALFCYRPDVVTFVQGSNTSFLFNDTKSIVMSLIGHPELEEQWLLLDYNDSYYLVTINENRGLYLGAIINTDSILNSFSVRNDAVQGLYLASASDHTLQRGNEEAIQLSEKIAESSPWIGNIQGRKVLVINKTVIDNIHLFYISSMSDIREYYIYLINSVIITLLIVIVVWALISYFMKRIVLNPVTTLTKAMADVGKGNLDHELPLNIQPAEFSTINYAYNDMIKQIKDLKIDAYEKKIEHQQLETQYLKQQIAPHFMINCLNTAYQLTEFGELALSQKMLRSLSDHLRYILSSRQKVSLKEELALVENYIEMSKIRYPDSIVYHLSVDEDAKEATVVPLLIVNFVENTIKHNAVMGKELVIEVTVRSDHTESFGRLYITVADSGKGFDPEILTLLNHFDNHYFDDTLHIGIQNTILRATDALPTTTFHFQNADTPGGAVIEMDLPYRRFIS